MTQENMEENDTEVRVLTSSRDLDDYDILSLRMISAAVPHKTSESFRKFIWAAMVTYSFGNQSIDYVMRRYDWAWDKYKKGVFERNPRVLILRELVELINGAAARLEKCDKLKTLGHICAKAALCRLEATFKSAYGLIRKEYILESDAIVRLILEQLAWSYVAYSSTDEVVQNLEPTKCISSFKNFFAHAGSLYGELSEWAHIDPSIISNYLRFHQNNIPVVRRSEHNSLQSGIHMTALAIIYFRLIQHLFLIYQNEEYEQTLDRLNSMYEKYSKLSDESESVES